MCEIRKRGNHPTKTPAVLTPGWEDGPHFAARPAPKCSRAAGPLDVTAPSHLLLNFISHASKNTLEEGDFSGAGGFRTLGAVTSRLPAFPALPKAPRSRFRDEVPSPPGLRESGRGRGRGTGGARARAGRGAGR